jgi:CRISPR-associated protein Cmr3
MSADLKPPHRLALVPRDGFFVKDGRGWQSSARSSVLDWPWPTTIRGVLTTASGKLIEAEEGRPFDSGRWRKHRDDVKLRRIVALRRSHGGDWCRMWPVPADALWLENAETVLPLQPTPMPEHTRTLGRAAPQNEGYPEHSIWREGYEAAREALWVAQNIGRSKPAASSDACAKPHSVGKPLPSPRWWPEPEMVAWLCGRPVQTDPGVEPTKRWPSPQRRLQTHVSISGETLTGEDGQLYLHDVVETLELRREWAIGVEAEWPAPVGPHCAATLPALARLGSDSRIVRVETEKVSPALFELPQDVAGEFASKQPCRLRLMTVTPACFERGWLPDGFAPAPVGDGWQFHGTLSGLSGEFILHAACVPRPMHVSGWDMANGRDKGGAPRATSRLVPPGAVYFFERADGRPFTADDARALWLAAVGGRTDEGFGRVVPGVWDPEDTK